MKKNTLVIFIFIFLLSGCKEETHPTDKLNPVAVQGILYSVPKKDCEVLDSFFRFLFSDDAFTYTLHGEKPMSMAVYLPHGWNFYKPASSLILEKGGEVWRKHAHKFPSDEFVLKFFKDNRGVSNILLISKTNMFNVIHKNLEIFNEVLGQEIDPKQLVSEICYGEGDFMEILKENSILLGILLGFGNVNSQYFERKMDVIEAIIAKMTPPFSPIEDLISLKPESKILIEYCQRNSFSNKQFSKPSNGFSNLGDELNEILLHQEGVDLYGDDFWLEKHLSPAFMMDRDDSETKELQAEYLATKKKINQAYSKGDFLEVTLNQWMNPL